MRCLVWRYHKDEPWRIFGINRMHFRDRPAAAGLEVAKEKVAELGKSIDSQTAEIITRGCVDDSLGGGDEYAVKKLIRDEYFNPKEEVVKGEAGSDMPGYPEPPLQSPLLNSVYVSA